MDANRLVVENFLDNLKALRERHQKEKSDKSRYALVRHESLMAQWGMTIPPTS